MFRKMFLVLFIIVLVTGALGFGLVPGLDSQVMALLKILFFILLIPFLISLFDVIGEAFRRGPRNG